MVYCGKPSKGCATCRAKRTKVRKDALPLAEISKYSPQSLSQTCSHTKESSVINQSPRVVNAEELAGSVLAIGTSKISGFGMKPEVLSARHGLE
jgi:hypothetical protein